MVIVDQKKSDEVAGKLATARTPDRPDRTAPSEIQLPMARYRLSFLGNDTLWFTDFPGSAWRGALGHALRRIACTTQLPICSRCPEYRRCAYPLVFETPPPLGAEKMRLYPQVPHPFVLVHRNLKPDLPNAHRRCELLLTMIGNADLHAGTVIKAFEAAAVAPRGISGNRMRLQRVERERGIGRGEWELWPREDAKRVIPPGLPMPPAPEEVVLQLLTPLRVKRDGVRVGPAEFRFADMFVNLMRRVSQLTHFHTDRPLDVDFRGLADAAKSVEAEIRLEWRDLDRYSSRQQTEMTLGGVIGQIRVRDIRLPLFWPFLWLGQWTHGGTGATMGLGRYSILASLPAQPPEEGMTG
jgi:hypothetical protein